MFKTTTYSYVSFPERDSRDSQVSLVAKEHPVPQPGPHEVLADWSNSSVLAGDVATEVAKLKAQVGKDLVIYGHGLLGQTLLKHHLLDELKLWIHPCFVGRGKLLFREGEKTSLKLIAQKTLATGVIVASYQPVTT
jgi:dihydrofolate reductase